MSVTRANIVVTPSEGWKLVLSVEGYISVSVSCNYAFTSTNAAPSNVDIIGGVLNSELASRTGFLWVRANTLSVAVTPHTAV